MRRKFVEAEPHYPGPCAEVLDLIGQLYAVERACPRAVGAADEAEQTELRQRGPACARERSAPLVAAIRAWAQQQRALPESSLGKAIAYMLGLWPGLTRFLDDPRIPLDNNATERALRGMVIGRKNHYGSRSQRGTEVAALFYSLIESAKLCGVEPKAYLLQAARAALATPGTVTLPHALLPPDLPSPLPAAAATGNREYLRRSHGMRAASLGPWRWVRRSISSVGPARSAGGSPSATSPLPCWRVRWRSCACAPADLAGDRRDVAPRRVASEAPRL